jgi:hypothetical protein
MAKFTEPLSFAWLILVFVLSPLLMKRGAILVSYLMLRGLLNGHTVVVVSVDNSLRVSVDLMVKINRVDGVTTLNASSTITGVGVNAGAGLLQGTLGLTVSGAVASINASSNFATNINTGTSTGAVTIGNGAAGAILLQSGTSIGLTGATTVTGNFTLTGTGSLAVQKGTDFSTTGTADPATFTGSVIRLTGASTQTINSITGATDGRIITLINAAGQAAVIANQSGVTATERIITGTGTSISLAPDTSIELRYDTTTQRWRVIGGVGGTSVTTVGAVSGTSTANGATITGNTLNLAVADATNAGLVSTTAQNIAGAKTFSALLTANLGATVNGAAISLNDSSNFNTTINTGTSTGTVTIGNSAAGAITLQSGTTINLNAPTIVGNATTQALFNTVATTVNAFGAANTLTLGASGGTISVGNGGAS